MNNNREKASDYCLKIERKFFGHQTGATSTDGYLGGRRGRSGGRGRDDVLVVRIAALVADVVRIFEAFGAIDDAGVGHRRGKAVGLVGQVGALVGR